MEEQLPHDNQSSLDLPALRARTDELFKQFDADCETAVAQLENAARAAAIEESLRESRLSVRCSPPVLTPRAPDAGPHTPHASR